MRILMTLLIVLIVAIALIFLSVRSGFYNIAASAPHYDIVRGFLTTIRDQSIATQSEPIVPPPLTDSSLEQVGFRHYHSMCAMCHGAPGREPSEIAQGLSPAPPDLDTAALQTRYSNAELYWIIKNGIRMTGMPAFGLTHAEQDLWAIVAFIRKLPQTKAQQYAAMVEAAGLQEGTTVPGHQPTQDDGHGPDEPAAGK
jgi:mono/diheme cytochrome c family protein